MAKLSDRELNAKLMETLNISSSEAKKAFEELMKEKVAEIRKEVRQEVFEEFSKQAKIDRENIVESMNQLAIKVVNDEKKKNDIHRKNLIKEKLSLKEAKDNLEKEKLDNAAMIKENYEKKLAEAKAEMNANLLNEKASFISKASQFINDTVKAEVNDLRNDRKQIAESLKKFGQFVSEQVSLYAKNQREELKSLDALRVRLVKENANKLAESKKVFFEDAAKKMELFTNKAISREINEFRKDIAESRKKSFGEKIFEAFAREYAVKFFNEDKIVKSMMESVKANQNKLLAANKSLEKQLNESKDQCSKMSAINNKLMRAKIISEGLENLAKDKQEMMKKLVKDVPTEKLQESINRFLPMIMENSVEKKLNTDMKVLKEGRRSTFLTGENKNKRIAMSLTDEKLSNDLEKEIEKAIANSK